MRDTIPADHWRRIQEIFHGALALPPEERGPFLERQCEGDTDLASEVRSLLRAHEDTGPLGPAQPNDGMEGRVFGDRYRLDREIGEGGMATVYLARDLRSGADVAIKVLRRELTRFAARFLREIETLAELDHPNIVSLTDSGQHEDVLFYVMPYIGDSLHARLRRDRWLSVEDAVAIAREIGAALDHAHAHGVIHRDIKPANILLDEGRTYVVDFGIARAVTVAAGDRLTRTGVTVGTPAYMSREQVRGVRDLDARTDIYSLGCVLYEMLVGETPFTGARPEIVFAKQKNDPVPSARRLRPEIPESLDVAIQRALAKDRDERFASVGDLMEALGAEDAS